ncbi:MAG: hypothetical protein NDJ72_00665 [Elusimicrobia bacterium]|nr:hypothetical protein [Elusimicrobiota bacterium]
MTKYVVLAALCATAAHAGPAGEVEHAARLEASVEAALDRIIGPGRSAATVEARGERVTRREQSEISGTGGDSAPAESSSEPGPAAPSPSAILPLPGYAKKGVPAAPPSSRIPPLLLHAASEETVREGSFAVTGLRAWIFLDKGLDDAAAAEAVRVSLEILAIDPDRGDSFKVVRTSFLPAWRAAFSRPRGAGALALLAVACAAALASAALLGFAALRSSRALADAIRAVRAPAAVSSPPAPLPARRILPLPPLGKGGLGS